MKSLVCAFMAGIYFASQVVLGHAFETNFWEERGQHITKQKAAVAESQLAWLPPIQKSLPLSPSSVLKTNDSKSLPSAMWKAPASGMDSRLVPIPFSSAHVRETYLSPKPSAPLLLLIQDVHLNEEAQTNIARTLEALLRQKNARFFVGVEGAFEDFDFTAFRDFPDQHITSSLARHFLLEGKIAAPSFVGLTTPPTPARFVGVDDVVSYDKNVDAYRRAIQVKPQLKEKWLAWQGDLEKDKSALNPALAEFVWVRDQYRQKHKSFVSYAQMLAQRSQGLTELSLDLVLEQFLIVAQMESTMDLKKVEREREQILASLAPRLKKDELALLIRQSQAYRAGQVGYADFYQGLTNLIEKHGLDLAAAPHFRNYIQYLLLADGIQPQALLSSIHRLEKNRIKKLLRHPKEKDVIHEIDRHHLVGKLLDFALTAEEWKEYQVIFNLPFSIFNQLSISDFQTDSSLKINHGKLIENGKSKIENSTLAPFVDFYRQADIRSRKMVAHLKAQLPEKADASSVSAAAIVGGFHTPLMTELLKAEQISYAVVQPKLTKIESDAGSHYLSAFSREKTPIDKLFEGPKLFLAVADLGVGTARGRVTGREFRLVQRAALVAQGKVDVAETLGVSPVREEPRVYDYNGIQFSFETPGDAVVATSVRYPIAGLIHYLKPVVQRPLAEWWFPLFSVGPLLALSYLMPIGVAPIVLAFLLNAVIFVHVFHNNKNRNAFLVRLAGTTLILMVSSLLAGGEFYLWAQIPFFLIYTTLGHAIWNFIFVNKPAWQLSTSSDEDEFLALLKQYESNQLRDGGRKMATMIRDNIIKPLRENIEEVTITSPDQSFSSLVDFSRGVNHFNLIRRGLLSLKASPSPVAKRVLSASKLQDHLNRLGKLILYDLEGLYGWKYELVNTAGALRTYIDVQRRVLAYFRNDQSDEIERARTLLAGLESNRDRLISLVQVWRTMTSLDNPAYDRLQPRWLESIFSGLPLRESDDLFDMPFPWVDRELHLGEHIDFIPSLTLTVETILNYPIGVELLGLLEEKANANVAFPKEHNDRAGLTALARWYPWLSQDRKTEFHEDMMMWLTEESGPEFLNILLTRPSIPDDPFVAALVTMNIPERAFDPLIQLVASRYGEQDDDLDLVRLAMEEQAEDNLKKKKRRTDVKPRAAAPGGTGTGGTDDATAAASSPRPPPKPIRTFLLRWIVFALVSFLFLILVQAYPDILFAIMKWTNLDFLSGLISQTSHPAVVAVGFGGFTYLGVSVIAILFEFVAKVGWVFFRRFLDIAGRPVRYQAPVDEIMKDPEGHEVKQRKWIDKEDGYEIDFLSTKEQLKRAIKARFSHDDFKIHSVDFYGAFGELTRDELFALYYELDKQAKRLFNEKITRDQMYQKRKKPVSWVQRILLSPLAFVIHMYTFLRDFFFKTHIERANYFRWGRFVNHYESANQAKFIFAAAMKKIQAHNAPDAFFVWYSRNNIFFAGLLGYIYRRIRITIFAFLGGWVLFGLIAVFPFLGDLSANFLHGYLASSEPSNFISRYWSIFIHHLNFSFVGIMSGAFTAFGLLVHGQLRRFRKMLADLYANPFHGVGIDFSMLSTTDQIQAALKKEKQRVEEEIKKLLPSVRKKKEGDFQKVDRTLADFEKALQDAQDAEGNYDPAEVARFLFDHDDFSIADFHNSQPAYEEELRKQIAQAAENKLIKKPGNLDRMLGDELERLLLGEIHDKEVDLVRELIGRHFDLTLLELVPQSVDYASIQKSLEGFKFGFSGQGLNPYFNRIQSVLDPATGTRAPPEKEWEEFIRRKKKVQQILGQIWALTRGNWPPRWSQGNFSYIERVALEFEFKDTVDNLQALFEVTVGVQVDPGELFRHLDFPKKEFQERLRRAPDGASPRLYWLMFRQLFRWSFWWNLIRSWWGMWTLGGEIATVVEFSGDVGALVGMPFGYQAEGRAIGRGVMNLLEGEHNSAMSLMSQIQEFIGVPSPPFADPDAPPAPGNPLGVDPDEEAQANPNNAVGQVATAPPPPQEPGGDDPPPGDRDPSFYTWVPEAARLSGARWGLLRLEMREAAFQHIQNNAGDVVELPELATNARGIPIQMRRVGNQTFLLFSDGTRQSLAEAMAPANRNNAAVARFDPVTRTFLPPQGRQFRYVILNTDPNVGDFRTQDRNLLFDRHGRAIDPIRGFRVYPRGDVNAPTRNSVEWRLPDGRIVPVAPRDTPANAIHPVTHFEIIFESDVAGAQRALTRAQNDVQVLQNRIRVTQELIENPQNVTALVVDPTTYDAVNRLRQIPMDSNGQPRLIFYRQNGQGQFVRYNPLTVPDTVRPDRVTILGRDIGFDGANANREYLVRFAVSEDALQARVDAATARTRTLGAISTAMLPNASTNPGSIYMLVRNRTTGEIRSLPTLTASAQYLTGLMRDPTVRLPAGLLEGLTGGGQQNPFSVPQARWGNLEFFTHGSEMFQENYFRFYVQQGQRGGVYGVRYNDDITEMMMLDRAGQREANTLLRLLTPAQRMQLARDGIVLLTAAQRAMPQAQNDVAVARIRFTNGVFAQGLTQDQVAAFDSNLRAAAQSDWIIRYNLGYAVNDDGDVVRTYTNPLELRTILQRSDLVYVLANGTRVPAHQVTASMTVVSIYDPAIRATLHLGSEWLRLNYLMDEGVRRELLVRPGVTPAAFIQVPGRPGQPIPYTGALRVQLEAYLAQLRMQIANAPNNNAREALYRLYVQSRESQSFPSPTVPGARVTIQGTAAERLVQSGREYRELIGALYQESLQGSRFGGEIVISNGRLSRELEHAQTQLNRLRAQLAALPDNAPPAQRRPIETAIRERQREIARYVGQLRGQQPNVQMVRYADQAARDRARTQYDAYLTRLRAQLNAAGAPPDDRERATLRIQNAVRNFSYIPEDQNAERVIVAGSADAERQARLRENYSQMDREMLEVELALMRGNPTVIHFRFQRMNDRIVVRRTYEAVPAFMADVNNNWNALDRATLLRTHRFSRIRADGTGDRYILINNDFARGGAIHVVQDRARPGPAGRSYTIEPQAPADAVRDRVLGLWKRELPNAVGARRALLLTWIRIAEEDNVLRYIDNNRQHTWLFHTNLREAQNSVALMQSRLQIAQAQENAQGAVVYELDPNDRLVRLIADAPGQNRVQVHRERLMQALATLQARYQVLNDLIRRAPDAVARANLQPEFNLVTRLLRETRRGMYRPLAVADNGEVSINAVDHRFILLYDVEEAERYYNRVRHQIPQTGRPTTTLVDRHGVDAATVVQGQTASVITIPEVVTTFQNGLTLVENRTYVGSRIEPNTEIDLLRDRGRLSRIERVVVDGNNQRRFVITGRLQNNGNFAPERVTQFFYEDDDLNARGIPSRSQTYRYDPNLRFNFEQYEARLANQPNLLLNTSRVVGTPEIRDPVTGRLVPHVEYENTEWYFNGPNNRDRTMMRRWREVKDLRGQLRLKREGVIRNGQFIVLRETELFYENPDYASANIASRSVTHAVRQQPDGTINRIRVLARSNVIRPFSYFARYREVPYLLVDALSNSRFWEVRRGDGLLTRRFSLRPIKDEQDRIVRWAPFNETEFRYLYGNDNQGTRGIADLAYTYETDAMARRRGNNGQYFESTTIANIIRTQRGDIRFVYQVGVRTGQGHDFLQFRHVKDPEGNLLEEQVGYLGPNNQFVPLQVTFHQYNMNGTGRLGMADSSRTYLVHVPDPASAGSLDFSEVDHRAFHVVRPNYELILREYSQLDPNSLADPNQADPGGVLRVTRTRYTYTHSPDGELNQVVQSRLEDAIEQGRWIESFDEHRRRQSNIVYDDTKTPLSARVLDLSHHPSLLGTGRLREVVTRTRNRIMPNPYLPDLPNLVMDADIPGRHWRVFNIQHHNSEEEPTYLERRWETVTGQTAVRVENRQATDGTPQQTISVHVSDQDPLRYQVVNRQTTQATITLNGTSRPSGLVDVSAADFIYFQVDPLHDHADDVNLDVRLTVQTGQDGPTLTFGTEDHPFWLANDENVLEAHQNRHVRLVADSIYQDRQFVFAVPVRDLLRRGFTMEQIQNMNPQATVTVNRDGNVPVRVSQAYRAGNSQAQFDDSDLPENVPVDAVAHPNFEGILPSGQSYYFDGTFDLRLDRGVVIRSPDNRVLAVLRSHMYSSAVTTEPLEMRRLILYDQSGQYPIASVLPRFEGGQMTYDPASVIYYSVFERGNLVYVAYEDPVTNPRYVVSEIYRINAIDPSEPIDRRVGQLSHLPHPQSRSIRAQLVNRTHNTIPYLLVRYFGGEDFSRYGSYETAPADVLAAFGRIEALTVREIEDHLDQMNELLPEEHNPRQSTPILIQQEEQEEENRGFWFPVFSWSWSFFLIVAAILAGPIFILWPFWYLIKEWGAKRRWKKARRKLLGTVPDDHQVYDEEIMKKAFHRFSEKILETKVRDVHPETGDPLTLTADGNIEGAFLHNLFAIYILTYSFYENTGGTDDNLLEELDEFAHVVSKYLSMKTGQGSDEGVSRYYMQGKFDPQIWDKLELYLASYREKLRVSLRADLRDVRRGNDGTRFLNSFDYMRRSVLVEATHPDVQGIFLDKYFEEDELRFDEKEFYQYIKEERFAPVPSAFITLGRHLFKLIPVLWIWVVMQGGAIQAQAAFLPHIIIPGILVVIFLSMVINIATERKAIRSMRMTHPVLGRLRAILPFIAVLGLSFILATYDGLTFSAFTITLMVLVVMSLEVLGLILPKLGWRRTQVLFVLSSALGGILFAFHQFNYLTFAIPLVFFLALQFLAIGQNRSLLGVTWTYHTGRSFKLGRPRAILLNFAIWFTFVAITLLLGWTIIPWFLVKYYETQEVLKAAAAFLVLMSRLPLLHHGINLGWTFIFSLFKPDFGAGTGGDDDKDTDHKIAVAHIGGQAMASFQFVRGMDVAKATNHYMTKGYDVAVGKTQAGADAVNLFVEEALQDPRLERLVSPEMAFDPLRRRALVETMLTALHEAEQRADPHAVGGGGTTLWSLRQMTDPDMPDSLKVGQDAGDFDQALIEYGFKFKRSFVEWFGTTLAHDSNDSAMNFVDMAEALADYDMAEDVIFINGFNQFNNHESAGGSPDAKDLDPATGQSKNRSQMGQRLKHAMLLQYVSRRPGKRGVKAYVAYDHTVYALKSGAMNMVFMDPVELPEIKSMLITDRNASALDVRKFVDNDIRRMKENKNILILVARRNSTYRMDAMGGTSFAIEGGHGNAIMGLTDKIGTGWMNLMRVKFWDALRDYGAGTAPFRVFTKDENSDVRDFGVIGFTPNAIGISEDYWAVLQQYHTMIGLGEEPEVGLSKALGHKMRESKDYDEWKPAPPRWSSGLVQSMESLLNQQINEFGPESFFEKEARQRNMDHYLLGPLILFDLFMLPLSVLGDLSPFVGISLVFWVPGIIVNQISTLTSLLNNVRHAGFWSGFSRWLQDRIPDSLLFSARTVRDILSQIAGYKGPTFEFKMSGGGGANPWYAIFPFVYMTEKLGQEEIKHRTPHIIWSSKNIGLIDDQPTFEQVVLTWDEGWIPRFDKRTVNGHDTNKANIGGLVDQLKEPFSFLNVFLIGIALIIINAFAMWYLVSTNAVMMILSLWFAVGVAFGPMLKMARRGEMVWGGWGDFAAKVAGWLFGLMFILIVAVFIRELASLHFNLGAFNLIWLFVVLIYGLNRVQKTNKNYPKQVRLASEMHRGFWMVVALFGWFSFIPVHPIIKFDIIPALPVVFTPIGFLILVAALIVVLVTIYVLGYLMAKIQLRRGDSVFEPLFGIMQGLVDLVAPVAVPVLIATPPIALSIWIYFTFALAPALLAFSFLSVISFLFYLMPGRRLYDGYLKYMFQTARGRYLHLMTRHRASRGVDSGLDAAIDGLSTQINTFIQQEAYRFAHRSLDSIEALLEMKRRKLIELRQKKSKKPRRKKKARKPITEHMGTPELVGVSRFNSEKTAARAGKRRPALPRVIEKGLKQKKRPLQIRLFFRRRVLSQA